MIKRRREIDTGKCERSAIILQRLEINNNIASTNYRQGSTCFQHRSIQSSWVWLYSCCLLMWHAWWIFKSWSISTHFLIVKVHGPREMHQYSYIYVCSTQQNNFDTKCIEYVQVHIITGCYLRLPFTNWVQQLVIQNALQFTILNHPKLPCYSNDFVSLRTTIVYCCHFFMVKVDPERLLFRCIVRPDAIYQNRPPHPPEIKEGKTEGFFFSWWNGCLGSIRWMKLLCVWIMEIKSSKYDKWTGILHRFDDKKRNRIKGASSVRTPFNRQIFHQKHC